MVLAEPLTLAGVMSELAARGFTEHFRVVEGRLEAVEHGKVFPADQVAIAEYHRFEGVSDPDDMAILYGLETRGGLRGTLTDAFGVYSDPMVGAFMQGVVFRGPAGSARAAGPASPGWR